ncbi:uncharacterized protein LOC133196235 [Saccostrea echinata]|uniref:uncharacterized protein LOC133196235 n=1 Tax=Saccostrea echinata TaxID=191078 RepID=UPI002A8050DD|nr:uncharacterized protein LOC133196235 [Saccostrea echinata]
MTTKEKQQTSERAYSESYCFLKKGGKFGCCLIVNINKTLKTIGDGHSIKKFRTGAEAEVRKLEDVFGWTNYQTEVIKEEDGKKCVLTEIDEYIKKRCAGKNSPEEGNFQTCDIFICVVLAFGGPGFFYNSKGNKIPLSTVVRKFQSCQALHLKPKLFIVQSCDIDLQPIGKHLFGDVEGGSKLLSRWPREADVLIYESNISGEYDWHPCLIKLSSENPQGKAALQSCTFIKYFCNTMKSLQDEKKVSKKKVDEDSKEEENYIEFNEVILRTNKKLEKFIKNRMNWDLVDGTWNTIPRLPVVTDQLSKQLFLPRFY